MFNSRPLQRLLFIVGVGIAVLGVYFASRSSHELEWDSIVSIAIIAVGSLIAILGLIQLLDTNIHEPLPASRTVLPRSLIPMIFGGFVGAIAVVTGLVVGHYQGRNEGLITFIFAFILANILFGLGLALGRAPSYR